MSQIKDNPEFPKYQKIIGETSKIRSLLRSLCEHKIDVNTLNQYKLAIDELTKLVSNLEKDTQQIAEIHQATLDLCNLALINNNTDILNKKIEEYVIIFQKQYDYLEQLIG